MNTITTIYWLRMALGITAGAICAALSRLIESSMGIDGITVILYSIVLTLLIYMLSLRLLKAKFQNKVETPSKITMTGIGMYFFAWLTFYILFYTIILAATGSIPTTEVVPPTDAILVL
ncbi:MAG: hypothetical protein LBC12_07955 [Nitrososphaerota archaeon]|jgi:hypothetical protein|nr:hypothetical protein [Nitrososphaerota archaeon]